MNFELVAQHSSEGVKDESLVVYEEDFIGHDRFLSARIRPDAFAIAESRRKGEAEPLRRQMRHEAGVETLRPFIGTMEFGDQFGLVEASVSADDVARGRPRARRVRQGTAMSPVSGSYDYRDLALPLAFAMATAAAALEMAGRAAAHRGSGGWKWLWGGAAAMGSGLWAMHLTGMLAYRLPFEVHFHAPTLAISWLGGAFAGLAIVYVASRQPMTAATLSGGSLAVAAGIAVMQLSAVDAMRLAAVREYRSGPLLASIVLDILISFVGLLLVYHSRDENRDWTAKLAITLVIGLAIPLVHSVSMSAMGFIATSAAPELRQCIEFTPLATAGVAAAAFLVLGLAAIAARADRLRTGQTLSLSDEFSMLRALIDNMPDFMYVKDRQSRFVVANKHVAQTIGEESPEKLLGRTDFDFFPPEIARHYFEDEQSAMRSGQALYNREEKGRGIEGHEVDILTTKVPVRDQQGRVIGIAGIGRDITARKKMENDLREAEQRYRGIFDNAIIGVFQCRPNGLILGVNRSMARNSGYDSPEEMMARVRNMAHLFPDRKVPEKFKQQLDEAGFVHNFECELCRKNGGKGWMAMSAWTVVEGGAVIRYEGISEDISTRKKMENDLREAEQKYRGIFDNALVGIYQSTPDGHLLDLNAAMAASFGYGSVAEALQGTTEISSQCYVDPKRRDEFKRVMESEGSVQCFESEFCRKDGSRFWLSMSARGVYENGVMVRYEGMCEDVTERKALREQLLQSQKLESVGQLAAGIAHEINTPTQYIGDNVRFLKDAFEDLKTLLTDYERRLSETGEEGILRARPEGPAEEGIDADYLLGEIPKAIDQTLEGVGRVAALVNAMKEFSHPDTKEKVTTDLNRAIAATINVARNEWKYVADLETHFDSSLPLIPCHTGEINQVILNLIVNAAHAIGDVARLGGRQRGTITVETRRCAEWAEVRIEDSGTGIPEKLRTRVFDPFFTTKEVGKGTGQGLAIARSVVVDKHGGSLHFETEEGKGTTFIVRLPYDGKSLGAKAVAA
jgi:PAS domain S-box-containing protein